MILYNAPQFSLSENKITFSLTKHATCNHFYVDFLKSGLAEILHRKNINTHI